MFGVMHHHPKKMPKPKLIETPEKKTFTDEVTGQAYDMYICKSREQLENHLFDFRMYFDQVNDSWILRAPLGWGCI